MFTTSRFHLQLRLKSRVYYIAQTKTHWQREPKQVQSGAWVQIVEHHSIDASDSGETRIVGQPQSVLPDRV